jgi:hypothetical protein
MWRPPAPAGIRAATAKESTRSAGASGRTTVSALRHIPPSVFADLHDVPALVLPAHRVDWTCRVCVANLHTTDGKWITQLDPRGTSVGRWRVGSAPGVSIYDAVHFD